MYRRFGIQNEAKDKLRVRVWGRGAKKLLGELMGSLEGFKHTAPQNMRVNF